MSFSINTNYQASYANDQLTKAHNSWSDSLQRISTGNKINSAADNASGLSIADSLKSQALGMGQAIRNANDGISITAIADGALGDVTDIINTIKTKSIQAANASQSGQSRQAIQADIDKSLESLDQITKTTSFNGQKLLSGFTNKSFQIGVNAGETINISIDSVESSKLGNGETTGSLSEIDVTTEEGAQMAMEIADQALQQVDAIRSGIGSSQNQLASTINNLETSRINAYSSESTIRDTDYAEESMILNKMDMLLQARTFAAQQANISKKNMISLLT